MHACVHACVCVCVCVQVLVMVFLLWCSGGCLCCTYSVICTSMKSRMKMRKAGMMAAKMIQISMGLLTPIGLMNQPRLLGDVGLRLSGTSSFCKHRVKRNIIQAITLQWLKHMPHRLKCNIIQVITLQWLKTHATVAETAVTTVVSVNDLSAFLSKLLHTTNAIKIWQTICSKYMFQEGRKMFYLTTHSTHFIYGYMASNIW